MSRETENQNGWNEWSRHVLSELKRLNDNIEKLDKKLVNSLRDHDNQCKERVQIVNNDVKKNTYTIAQLQVKSGVWGIIGGAVTLFVALSIWIIKTVL